MAGAGGKNPRPALGKRDSTPEEGRAKRPCGVSGADYPHPAACRIPSVRATQLKGRELDESRPGYRPPGASGGVETPRFLIGGGLCPAASGGTAMHLLMQYLDLSGPGAGEAGAGPAGPASAC